MRALFRSPDGKGFMDSPAFFGAFGAFCGGFGLYTAAVGHVAMNKTRTFTLTRAGDPGLFWFVVLLMLTLGTGLLWHAVRQYRRNVE